MAPVYLKELLACGQRLGITQVVEPPGVRVYAEGVCTHPEWGEGLPPLFPGTIMIIPPEVRGASPRGGPRTPPFPQTDPGISCAAFAASTGLNARIRSYSVKTRTPVFSSSYDAPLLQSRLIGLIGELGERRVVVHGVLVQMSGVGVLITGQSGSGKTAAGLELVRQGGRWVADDVVVLEGRGTALYGHGHQRVRDWIAPRGRGLLRAESLLGAEVLLGEARVDCILRLVRNSRCEAADEDGRNLTVRRIVGVDLPCWSLAAGGGSRRVAERVMAVIGGFRPLPDGSASDHGQRHRKGKRVGLKRSSGAECGWDVDSTGG